MYIHVLSLLLFDILTHAHVVSFFLWIKTTKPKVVVSREDQYSVYNKLMSH